jgi:transposase
VGACPKSNCSSKRIWWRNATVAVVDAAGGTVPLADGRTVTVGRAEFDTLVLAQISTGLRKTGDFRGPAERLALLLAHGTTLVLELKTWLEQQLARVSGKSPIAEAIRYGLNHWEGLIRFLDDGRIELDTNIVERSIRPIVLNRKNALFAGHDQGAENWACIASLIETCKLHGVDPQAYFTDVLTKLVNLWPASRLDDLMPWAWEAERAANRRAA